MLGLKLNHVSKRGPWCYSYCGLSKHRVELRVWQTLSGICCTEGPSKFSTQSAEVRLAVSGGQLLFTLGLLMFALSLVDFRSLLWGPGTDTYNFKFSKVSFEGHTQNPRGFKAWMECVGQISIQLGMSSISGFFSCSFDVLIRLTYANMLVATKWPLKRAPHLTCRGLCGMEVWKLSALWWNLAKTSICLLVKLKKVYMTTIDWRYGRRLF